MSEDAKEPFPYLITIYTIGFTHKSAKEFFEDNPVWQLG